METDLDSIIKQNWKQELQTSDLNQNQFKAIGKFYAQFNEQLVQNKRQGVIHDILMKNESIYIEFDENHFNFQKIDQNQILYDQNEEFTVIMNISPLFKYHSLIVPYINQNLPQVLSADILQMIYTQLGDSNFRLMFNSIGSFASVNHLHMHLVNMENLEIEQFPVEKAKLKLIFNKEDIQIFETTDYPIKSLKLQGSIDYMIYYMNILIEVMMMNIIPYNAMISKDFIYLIPRQNQIYQNHFMDHIRCAIIEVLGIAVVRSQEFYDQINEEYYTQILQEVSLDEKTFDNIVNELFIDQHLTQE